MESDWWAWTVLLAGVFLIGMAAAAEIALSAVNRSAVRRRSEAGEARAQLLSQQLSDPAQFWLTVMAIKSLGLVAAAVAVGFMLLPQDWVLNLLVGILATWLALTLVQIAVRSWVLRNPDRVAFWLAPALHTATWLLAPVTFVFYHTGIRISGESDEDSDESIFLSEDGLRLLMQVSEEESEIQESEKQMIVSILEMDETVVREVMV
ncbi:MAG: CNNM domain-containing protein, partial [Caldilinea sp.]